jgi:DNA-binding NtrC family response regulator
MTTNRFPLSPALFYGAPAEAAESRRVRDNPGWSRPRCVTDILVISDTNGAAGYITSLFGGSGWSVDTARDCSAAISFVNERRAAVAVCDENLSDGSWQNLALAFSTIPLAPALIVISDDPALAKDVVALGGFDVLRRGLDSGDVLWSVASAWHAWWKGYEATHGGSRCVDA